MMYVFRLWFATERAAIAKQEIEPHRAHALSKARNQREVDIINVRFDDAEADVANEIHPLRLLRRIFTH